MNSFSFYRLHTDFFHFTSFLLIILIYHIYILLFPTGETVHASIPKPLPDEELPLLPDEELPLLPDEEAVRHPVGAPTVGGETANVTVRVTMPLVTTIMVIVVQLHPQDEDEVRLIHPVVLADRVALRPVFLPILDVLPVILRVLVLRVVQSVRITVMVLAKPVLAVKLRLVLVQLVQVLRVIP